MKATLVRIAGCAAALGMANLLFPHSCATSSILPGSIMLVILYTLIRPLLLVLLLPVNILVFGMLTPLGDALLVLWTSAWVNGMSLGYWQSAAVALLISAAYYPYSLYTKRRLIQNTARA